MTHRFPDLPNLPNLHVDNGACGSADHVSRRHLLKLAGCAGLTWLTPLSRMLALDAEKAPKGEPVRSVIILWLEGGPSQLETFDPHPDTPIAYGTSAIQTSVPDIQLASGLEQVAEVMNDVSLIRSVVSKEGDHERAVYNIKTGYRPNPAVVHPSIGAVICHQLEDMGLDIPRHVSIVPGEWPARGGYLGAHLDAFKVGDPGEPTPDVVAQVSKDRMARRLEGLDIVERAFARNRPVSLDARKTLHRRMTQDALKMMDSEQLKAFDIGDVSITDKAAFGDSAFGRGCLAAARIIEAGVRCVEVTLGGWDTHVNNHELQASRVATLDPAFAALIRHLKERDLLQRTIVLCGGEFGRTPKLNPLDGRDHWPKGFSIAIAGGGIAGGRVLGATDPQGEAEEPEQTVRVEDIHATVHHALGIDSELEIDTPVGRPIALSEGRILRELLS